MSIENQFCKLWRAGARYSEITEKTGLKRHQIQRMRRQLGLPVSKNFNTGRTKKHSDELCAKVREMQDEKIPTGEIARALGIDKPMVYKLGKRGDFLKIDEPLVLVPPERISRRDEYLAAPWRDLTGYLMGDPPVGFSALERR